MTNEVIDTSAQSALGSLFATLSSFSPIFIAMGGLIVVFGIMRFALGRGRGRGEQASRMGNTIFLGVVLAFVPLLPRTIVGLVNYAGDAVGVDGFAPEEAGTPTAEPTVPPSLAPTAPAEPAVPSTPADFSWLGNFVLIASMILLAALLVWAFFKFAAPSIVSAQEQSRRAKAIMDEATDVYGQTMLAQASYETDLAKQIDFPVMTDVTDEATAKYVKAMRNASLAVRTTPAKPSLDQAERLMGEVREFSVTFDAAEQRAHRLQWSAFTVAEQGRLRDARTALDLIHNGGLSDEARNAQYKRIAKLVQGLVTITDKSRSALAPMVPMLTLEKEASNKP